MDCANVAATLMEHLVDHYAHGYTQGSGRWGNAEQCWVTVDGIEYVLAGGDRDCSSSVTDCWKNAIYHTEYRGALDGATYTGNMRSVFVASGLFEWHPMGDGYIAKRGDIYLNEVSHTAMCISAVPDMLAEFSINEFGGITGGQVGDQTGYEAKRGAYYNFPWDGILAYNGKADDDMPSANEVAEAVWDYAINGYTAAKRLYLCNEMDYDTSDPTGREVALNDHDHIKWIGAYIKDVYNNQALIMKSLDAIAAELNIELDNEVESTE